MKTLSKYILEATEKIKTCSFDDLKNMLKALTDFYYDIEWGSYDADEDVEEGAENEEARKTVNKWLDNQKNVKEFTCECSEPEYANEQFKTDLFTKSDEMIDKFKETPVAYNYEKSYEVRWRDENLFVLGTSDAFPKLKNNKLSEIIFKFTAKSE